MTIVQDTFDTVIPAQAKWSFTTRLVDAADVAALKPIDGTAKAGDLILVEITEVNQHKKIQLANGRYADSYAGDLAVLCLGDRYAPDQFMGRAELREDALDLLAGGGICGVVEAKHAKMAKPTQLRPLGRLVDRNGIAINIAKYAINDAAIPDDVTVIGVFGASMNAGKTTAAVSLAHGLARAGYRVAGVKATGTGAFGDFNAFRDASIPVTDFTDAGMPSTFRMPMERIERGFNALVGTAAREGAEIVVVEIADGVFQGETAAILKGSAIVKRMDGILFATSDALGAVGGVSTLARYGHRPFALSGMLSLSTLGTIEAETETNLPVISRDALCDGRTAADLIAPLMRTKTQKAA
ncbi:hypothetical protein KDD17_01745 [Sulfitobacter albidus]|uniref:DUF1611 domain-containing protein n=1 Tax=Sulfitobacter albidus TaxID=2829501 RepID=A0A975JEK7_9RHOB|nr:hypothetical protein [Sulfitobacter albidus]QUJ76811.1 hypothetical protein KDD17_01745 [Sulfitobacter albidus]